MIRRKPTDAAQNTFDLVVIGAGIHGVATALEAARRGLGVVVIDRSDFGGETSWNSLRILHGGLRYLQTFDLARFRESVRARSWYVREFPSLVEPFPCLMPLYGEGLRRKAMLRPVLALNEQLRRIWSAAAERDLIPVSRVLSNDEVREWFPGVRTAGLRGGALWYDAYLPQPQRVLIEMLRRVAACGGEALNYMEAIGWVVDDDGRIGGVNVRDRLADTDLLLRSRAVLNCAGPWAHELDASAHSIRDRGHAPSLAFNLLLNRPLDSDAAVAVEPVGGGRTYFLHPLGSRTLAGTFHAPAERPGATPTDRQISQFIDDLSAALPGFGVTRDDVLRVLAGTLPARHARTDDLATRDLWIDAGADGGPCGLFTLVGVKYTTAPLAARRAVDRIMARCFPGGSRFAVGNRVEPEPRAVPGWPAFARISREEPERARALVRSIVAEESVTSVEDLLLRRSDWGLVPTEFDEAEHLVRSLYPERFNAE